MRWPWADTQPSHEGYHHPRSDRTRTPQFSRTRSVRSPRQRGYGVQETGHTDAPGDDDAPPDDERAGNRDAGSRRIAGWSAGPLADRSGGLVARTLAQW